MSRMTPEPNILIVTCEYAPFPGGIGTYASRLAATLRDAGVAVSVIAPRYPELTGSLPDGVRHRLLFEHHGITASATLGLLGELRSAAARDIILVADIRSLLLVWSLGWLHRRKYRVMVHGSEASKLGRRNPLALMAKRAYRSAQGVVYNSRATQQIFRKQVRGLECDAVTYLGVDQSWFDPPLSPDFEHPALHILQSQPDRPCACTIGRLEPRKGQLQAIAALAVARDRFALPEPVYVAAGRTEDPAYAAEIERIGRELGIRTIMPGRITEDDVKRLYRRSLVHLLPAQSLPGRIEGFGLVLLEAAAGGCPSVTSREGGIPEVLGDAGLQFDSHDVEGMGAAIARLAAHSEERRTLRDAALQRARQFDWRTCAMATFPEVFAIRRAHRTSDDPAKL
jgi:phosphatidyl-myo-inositol dimannoside synthase